jgi:arylsulfatase A-like enzyme
VNVLFITLDQFRADCLSAAGHPVVKTPHLDRLAGEGVRFACHFSQAAPCGPGRASLYTGLYQMNHRVLANGSPLDDRFDNVARLARRAGYPAPALFGYTDQTVDPAIVSRPDDPRLRTYQGVLAGFDPVLLLDDELGPWLEWLDSRGYGAMDAHQAQISQPERPEELSASWFLTDHLLDWIASQDAPWFAHASYLRPHPPYAAAGHWARRYRPDALPDPVPVGADLHRLHRFALTLPYASAPTERDALAHMRAQYLGMVSEVDEQIGRIVDFLIASGQYDQTVVVVTSDHGEQLGDHGLKEKLGFFEQSYRIPCLIRHPAHQVSAGRVVDEFTEAVDVFPTLAEMLGLDPPVQCDGLSLVPFLRGDEPTVWRQAAHYEWDWRAYLLGPLRRHGAADPSLDLCNLAVERNRTHAYVHFGDGSWLCFDLEADPDWHSTTDDPAVVLPLAQSMLTWRSNHLGGAYSQMLLGAEPKGLWPQIG